MLHFMHMAAKEMTLKELGEMLTHVVEHMATKDAIADIRKRMATKSDIAALTEHVMSVERELNAIRRELNDLREKVENVTGFRNEIDHALERIAVIEKHLGLEKKIAA